MRMKPGSGWITGWEPHQPSRGPAPLRPEPYQPHRDPKQDPQVILVFLNSLLTFHPPDHLVLPPGFNPLTNRSLHNYSPPNRLFRPSPFMGLLGLLIMILSVGLLYYFLS